MMAVLPKMNWTYSPFRAPYPSFLASSATLLIIDPNKEKQYQVVKRKFMTYDYYIDKGRLIIEFLQNANSKRNPSFLSLMP